MELRLHGKPEQQCLLLTNFKKIMKKILLQAVKFFGISGIGWILDFCTYALVEKNTGNIILSNCISSWVGVTFVFLFSTRLLFRNEGKIPLKIKYLIYITYQAILVFLISKLINFVNMQFLEYTTSELMRNTSFILSKIIVTPITMITNFFVMKLLIEQIK